MTKVVVTGIPGYRHSAPWASSGSSDSGSRSASCNGDLKQRAAQRIRCSFNIFTSDDHRGRHTREALADGSWIRVQELDPVAAFPLQICREHSARPSIHRRSPIGRRESAGAHSPKTTSRSRRESSLLSALLPFLRKRPDMKDWRSKTKTHC